MADHPKLTQPVINEKQLDQQWRAAKDQDIAFGEAACQRPAAHSQRQNAKGQHAAKHKRADKEPQRHRQRRAELQQRLTEEGKIDNHMGSLRLRGAATQPGAVQMALRPGKRAVREQRQDQIATAADEIEQEIIAGRASGNLAGAHQFNHPGH